MTDRQVNATATATAKIAHGGVPSGDNDPAATRELRERVAALDGEFGRAEPAGALMCQRTYRVAERR